MTNKPSRPRKSWFGLLTPEMLSRIGPSAATPDEAPPDPKDRDFSVPVSRRDTEPRNIKTIARIR